MSVCAQVSVHLKEGQGSDGLAALKNKPQLHSLVAKQLCQNICGKNTIIFTGPSMTSLSLFSEFSKQGRRCNAQRSEVSLGGPCRRLAQEQRHRGNTQYVGVGGGCSALLHLQIVVLLQTSSAAVC